MRLTGLLPGRFEKDALDGRVARLGAATRKDDFTGFCTEKIGDLFTCGVDSDLGGPTILMRAGWIAEMLAEIREHGIDDGGIQRGGGVVIEVDHPVSLAGRRQSARGKKHGADTRSAPRHKERLLSP